MAFYFRYEMLISSLFDKGNGFCMKRYFYFFFLNQRF